MNPYNILLYYKNLNLVCLPISPYPLIIYDKEGTWTLNIDFEDQHFTIKLLCLSNTYKPGVGLEPTSLGNEPNELPLLYPGTNRKRIWTFICYKTIYNWIYIYSILFFFFTKLVLLSQYITIFSHAHKPIIVIIYNFF